MKGKAFILSGALLIASLPVNVDAVSFMSSDDTVLEMHNQESTVEDGTSNFFSDDIFILAKYQDNKKLEEERIAKGKAEEEAKKKKMKSYAPKSSNFKAPEVNTENVGGLRLAIHNDDYDTMIRKVNSFLAGKGMSGQGVHVVNAGLANNVDPYFIAAISMTESTGGTYTVRPYNAWGRKARGGGWMTWSNWEEAIHNQAAYLAKNYLNIGLTSLESIGKKYCPPTYKDWARKVGSFQRQVANR